MRPLFLIWLFCQSALAITRQECPLSTTNFGSPGKLVGVYSSVRKSVDREYGYRLHLFRNSLGCRGFAQLFHGGKEPYAALIKVKRCTGKIALTTEPSFLAEADDEGPYERVGFDFRGKFVGGDLVGKMTDKESRQTKAVTLSKEKATASFLSDEWQRLHFLSECAFRLVIGASPLEIKVINAKGNHALAGPEWEKPLCDRDDQGTPGFLQLLRSERADVLSKFPEILTTLFTASVPRNCLFEWLSKYSATFKDEEFKRLLDVITAGVATNATARAQLFDHLLPPLKYGFDQCVPTQNPSAECRNYLELMTRAIQVTEARHEAEKKKIDECVQITDDNENYCRDIKLDKKNVILTQKHINFLSSQDEINALKVEVKKKYSVQGLDALGNPIESEGE